MTFDSATERQWCKQDGVLVTEFDLASQMVRSNGLPRFDLSAGRALNEARRDQFKNPDNPATASADSVLLEDPALTSPYQHPFVNCKKFFDADLQNEITNGVAATYQIYIEGLLKAQHGLPLE
jgi:hypothetical protein